MKILLLALCQILCSGRGWLWRQGGVSSKRFLTWSGSGPNFVESCSEERPRALALGTLKLSLFRCSNLFKQFLKRKQGKNLNRNVPPTKQNLPKHGITIFIKCLFIQRNKRCKIQLRFVTSGLLALTNNYHLFAATF